MSEEYSPFKMKGNPFTTGGVHGTESHESALKKVVEQLETQDSSPVHTHTTGVPHEKGKSSNKGGGSAPYDYKKQLGEMADKVKRENPEADTRAKKELVERKSRRGGGKKKEVIKVSDRKTTYGGKDLEDATVTTKYRKSGEAKKRVVKTDSGKVKTKYKKGGGRKVVTRKDGKRQVTKYDAEGNVTDTKTRRTIGSRIKGAIQKRKQRKAKED